MKNISFKSVFFYIFMTILIGLCYYFLFRNNAVFHYKCQLSVQRSFVDIKYHDEFVIKILDRYSYYDLLLSFKPLESKYWFSEEEINKYQLYLVDKACE